MFQANFVNRFTVLQGGLIFENFPYIPYIQSQFSPPLVLSSYIPSYKPLPHLKIRSDVPDYYFFLNVC